MRLNPLNKNETREIIITLNEHFGIKEIPFQIFKSQKQKIYLFSGNLTQEQIKNLQYNFPVEGVGIYFGKIEEKTKQIRLSIEGTQMFKNQITKNTFELNSKQIQEWMCGNELNIQTGKKGFIVIKHKNDFLGTGKASEEKIGNFVPKERRLKNR